jgi:hypothetical protein
MIGLTLSDDDNDDDNHDNNTNDNTDTAGHNTSGTNVTHQVVASSSNIRVEVGTAYIYLWALTYILSAGQKAQVWTSSTLAQPLSLIVCPSITASQRRGRQCEED